MNKEEKHLLKYELIIDYYKDDITKLYRRRSDNTCFDNDILNNEDDVLYITTLNKYQKLQQENKQLKDNWNKLKKYVNEVGSPFVDGYGYVQIEDKIVYVDDVLEEMKKLESGDSNE